MDKVTRIIDEISNLIKDNIQILYLYKDDSLIKLKDYCNNNVGKKMLTSEKLIEFTEEALVDLRDVNLFDFRDIE